MNRDTLPLFYHPSTWIYVDDDKNLLRSMDYLLKEHNFVKIFDDPQQCLDYLLNYRIPSSDYSFLKSITDDEHHGILHHTPIDFDVTSLAKFAEHSHRHEEITAMVIDYHMPQMDGLSLAKNCAHFPTQKILLTGKDRASQAIKGFNHNLIQRFVQKFEEGMAETLIAYLKALTLQYFQNLTFPLLTHLETENKLPLSDPIFITFFNDYCEKKQISEYYLIDKQGSFLLINKQNEKFCLVMHSEYQIHSWLSIYGNESDLSENDRTALTARRKIPFFGIGIEPWQINVDLWHQHLHLANTLEGREKYFWASINIS